MVKFGRVSRARPHGRRILGRCPNRVMRGLFMCGFGVPSRVEAVWDARWQVLGTLKAVLGHTETVALRRFMNECTC